MNWRGRHIAAANTRLGLLQLGDVEVGGVPEGEEVFVGTEHPDARGICVSAVRFLLAEHSL